MTAGDAAAGGSERPVVAAGTALGVGLGGFVDGILFHQILQLHSMLSAEYPTRGVPAADLAVNLEINMFWDGLFHALTWAFTAAGVAMLWNAARRPAAVLRTRTFVGSLLLGWGLFDVVEGVIDHHLLHIHHVIEIPGHLPYDVAFLAFGAALIVAGLWLIRERPAGA